MTQLESEILNIINETTCRSYIGGLRVLYEPEDEPCDHCVSIYDDYPTKSGSYTLLLNMNQELAPMVMSYQGDLDGFKEFIRKEFKTRKLEAIKY